jgi:hypothetical protein
MDFVTVYLAFGLIAVLAMFYFDIGAWLYQRGITLPFYLDMTEEVSSVSPDGYVTSNDAEPRSTAADTADGGLSGGLSALSGLQQHAVRLIMLDSSLEGAALEARTTAKVLVRALVAAGWKTGRIRQVVKGDNNVIGEWIAEARAELGLRDERSIGVGSDGRRVRL